MKQNLGLIDRILRAAFAVSVAVLYYLGMISGTAAIVLGAIAGILFLTSVAGFCPIYFGAKLSTKKEG